MSIEALSLDQIRVFITVADTGTFSAAAKRLGRVQSAISYAIANMEEQLQLTLFDRSHRRPQLTEAGKQILADARAIEERLSNLKARAKSMATGLEPKLSIAVEVLYPMSCLARVLKDLANEFPTLPIDLKVETLGGTAQLLVDGTCDIAIIGPEFARELDVDTTPLNPIQSLPVCAPDYLLAKQKTPLSKDLLHKATQLVLSDRSRATEGKDFGVFSPNTWRLSDIGVKHELLRASLGWGFMPRHLIESDLEQGLLVQIGLTEPPQSQRDIRFSIATRPDSPPGPGGRRFVELLRQHTGT